MPLRVALPKGRLLPTTATLLQKSKWAVGSYTEKSRLYRLQAKRFPELQVRIFQEKDIPIQVAIGNYDLGICGLHWIDELLVKFHSSAVVKVKNLNYSRGKLTVVANGSQNITTVNDLKAQTQVIRIASEFPNLAEHFAVTNRFRQFNIFPLWGGAEVYPPESADLALISLEGGKIFSDHKLVSISTILDHSAFLIANRQSLESKDMSELLTSLYEGLTFLHKDAEVSKQPTTRLMIEKKSFVPQASTRTIWLALPDGHQKEPTAELLNKTGISVDGYSTKIGNHRLTTNLADVLVKVVRPQDMPLQVANKNFDLAITGKDWLQEHLSQFPTSPVVELLDLKFGWVKVVAVISMDLTVSDIHELRSLNNNRNRPLRVASEYVNIADKYARDNHLGLYQVIPTWGATEAFLPEDADLLIENTKTGQTIARHNLKIIDTLFDSAACLIGHRDVPNEKVERINKITQMLRSTAEEE